MIEVGKGVDSAILYVRGRAEAIPVRRHWADAVWMSTALHHFGDLPTAVREISRVTRPGGRVLIRTYVPGHSEFTWVREFPATERLEERILTIRQMEVALGEGGFSLVGSTRVLEGEETYAEVAAWATRMRHADSLLTAFTDDEFDAGIDALLSAPNRMSRLGLTLVAFQRT